MQTYYISTMGSLYRDKNSIVFENSVKKNKIPINTIRSLYLLNEVSLNSKLLNILNDYNITVHFFDYYGKYKGTFYPKNSNRSGKILLKQAEIYNSQKRIEISKNIVRGISININEILYHYFRHGDKEIKKFMKNINDLVNLLEKANNINSIMMIEGKIWLELYQSLDLIIKNKDFSFSSRTRRLPQNELNAMISFINSLLYAETITAISKTNLEQSIAFLHAPADGRFSLSLDLCEVFKPLVTFKVILSLVNNRRIRINEHFVKNLDGCLLNEKGRQIVLKSFDEKMSEVIYHTKMKRNVTYRTLLKYEGFKLLKTITENKEFTPFNIKEGR